ncbi:MAG: YoaK family protein [Steroidobacteraceae bacterium]|jgi:uncharacterized membrane protein YoaK (UPF0700 family)
MKQAVPTLLSFNGGFLDTAGYLALQGLFTAHVTGNFVTIGAALVFGTSGVVAKLLALPVFCIVIVVTRLASYSIAARRWPELETLLVAQLGFLLIGAVLAICLGPFANGDAGPAMVTGMVLVSAMAIQNATHRMHLSALPPTTIMTGTTTQIMIDIGDVIHGLKPEARVATLGRLRRMSLAVLSFAVGGAIAALLYSTVATWCFAVPPVVALLAAIWQKSDPAAATGAVA